MDRWERCCALSPNALPTVEAAGRHDGARAHAGVWSTPVTWCLHVRDCQQTVSVAARLIWGPWCSEELFTEFSKVLGNMFLARSTSHTRTYESYSQAATKGMDWYIAACKPGA